jgi:hypothetical protein
LASGTVFVLTPDIPSAVGGVKIHYQMVDALNGAGRPAFVVHNKPGFRCTWFENKTRVVAVDSVQLHRDDALVVPEEWVQHIPGMPTEVDKVIFNQNAYTTFLWDQPWPLVRDIYTSGKVRRVIVVSGDNLGYIRYAFPGAQTAEIQHLIDPATFYVDAAPKTRSIAYMPRKRADEAKEVLALLGARGALDGWEIVPIVNRSEAEAAEILRRASVFLSFSHREGFGLPPAEALACGCVVVGFHGFGGQDISPHALWVPDGDVLALARTIEDVLQTWDSDMVKWADLSRDGADSVRSRFTPEQFQATVCAAFDGVGATDGDHTLVGGLTSACWSSGPRWPSMVRHLRAAARVAIKGG